MISVEYCQGLAGYNQWQNQSLYREATRLSDVQRREDCGAFFKSIHGTLCHILCADHIWMHRFDGWEMPKARGDDSPDWIASWDDLQALRIASDERLISWASGLNADILAGNLTWRSGGKTVDNSAAMWGLVVHMFNHQTHHRGQVHAMLTGFDMTPDETDIDFMK
ncbi:MAG: DinB family protein [Paracoccaceae bacterium]